MKRPSLALLTVVALALVIASAAPVAAHDYERGDSDYPLRYIAYAIHPIGIVLEYGVTRPIHWLVSQPHLRIVFGHAPRNEIDENGNLPVCNLCRHKPYAVECPRCHKRILKPRDEYFVWK